MRPVPILRSLGWQAAVLAVLAAAVVAATAAAVGRRPAPPFAMDVLGAQPPRRETIVVVPYGPLPLADKAWIEEGIRRSFGFAVKFQGPAAPPEEARVDWTGQWDPAVLLDALVDAMPLDAVRVVGVVPGDLAGGASPWSMGMGQPEGKAAVLSTYRLVRALEEAIASGADAHAEGLRYRVRLYKLLCHELGHTFRDFGNIHCENRGCVMATVEFGLADLDAVPPRFCDRCRAEIGAALRGPVCTAVTFYNLGEYYEGRGLAARAEEAYGRAVLADGGLAQAWNNLGALRMRTGRLEEAEAALRRAVSADGSYALARVNLGRLLGRTGRPGEALACFERALALDPTWTVCWRDGGRVLRDGLEDADRARAWFGRFLEAGGRDEEVERWMEAQGK